MSSDIYPTLPAAMLFDMDGTLTEPMLDFPRIKAEMNIGDRPILEAMAEMDPYRLLEAQKVLARHEEQAARESTLNPGCRELLQWLESMRIGVALITRNSRSSVRTVLRRHDLRIDVLIAREDAPPKPNPQPLRLACDRLEIAIDQAWMVGDGQYDVEAGLAAGMRVVWLSHRRARYFAAEPWKAVNDLPEFHALLRRCHPRSMKRGV